MIRRIVLALFFVGLSAGCLHFENGEDTMENSILELTGVEASPVYCPRVADVNGKGSWQGTSGTNSYIVRAVAAAYASTSSDAVPSALQGSIYWYEYSTGVFYDPSNTYARWTSTTKGVIVSAVADVGNESVANFFKLKDYPDTITVSGAGNASFNGIYAYSGIYNSKPFWQFGSKVIRDETLQWRFRFSSGDSVSLPPPYLSAIGEFINPPKTEWSEVSVRPPAPTLAYTIHTDQYVGQGAWSGTITFAADTTVFAWQITGSYEVVKVDAGTWPPEDFDGTALTDLGQTITLDLQGGTGETTKYVFSATYGTFPTITRFAYIFAGWFTAQEGTGDRVYADTTLVVPDDDDTLYAKWINFQSGRVSNGKSMLSQFAIGVGTDLFSESITARKVRSEPVQVVLPIPPGESA